METEVTKRVRRRYAIPRNQAIPAELKTAIQKEVNKAVSPDTVKKRLAVETISVVKERAEASMLANFDNTVVKAKDAISHIGGSSEVDDILKERSEMMFKKKQALVTAGFSDTEAMEIILADIAARARPH
jgi:hypothetical protein